MGLLDKTLLQFYEEIHSYCKAIKLNFDAEDFQILKDKLKSVQKVSVEYAQRFMYFNNR